MTREEELQALNRELAAIFGVIGSPEGKAAQQQWRCEDGWIVSYTTGRVEGGKYAGKFLAMAYRPIGKGARTGQAKRWERVYIRAFSKRKLARARAEELFYKHSPVRAAKAGGDS